MIQRIRNIIRKAEVKAVTTVANVKAEGYVDTAVKILIAVVIGALLLVCLYALFNTNVLPTLTEKVNTIFGYTQEVTDTTPATMAAA